MKKFREEDLILYLYQDCSSKLSASIEAALAGHDLELKDRLDTLRRSMRQLNKIKLKSPSKRSVKMVLKYAGEAVAGRK